MKRLTAVAALAFVSSLAHVAGATAAEDRKECSAAAEKAQRLKNDGKLKDAREQLVVCARNVCPAVVRKDCEPWLTEVEQRLPSVVIAAKDPKGKDVVDVRVTIDGQKVADTLDGKAITLDPGVHSVRYERQGSPVVEDKLVIREGERGRVVNVSFDSPNGTKDDDKSSASSKAAETTTRTETTSGAPVAAFVVAGLGVVALGSFAFFHFSAKSDIDDMRTSCAPRCDQSRVDDANTKIIVSDVSLGAGAVALVVAAYLFVARPTKVVEVRTGALHVQPVLGGTRGGAFGGVGVTF